MDLSVWSHFGQVPMQPSPEEAQGSSVNGMPYRRQNSLRSSRSLSHLFCREVIYFCYFPFCSVVANDAVAYDFLGLNWRTNTKPVNIDDVSHH